MPGKLLTVRQAADYLGVRVSLLASWRTRRQGPRYLVLEADPDRTPVKARRIPSLIRYDVDHLDEWIAARVVDPKTLPGSPYRTVSPRGLTDAEWAAVRPFVETIRIFTTHERRGTLDGLLEACDAEKWKTEALQTTTAKNIFEKGWICDAFRALGAFPGFPYALVAEWFIVRRYDRGRKIARTLRIGSVVHGRNRPDETAETDS